jgi:RimJ/RimL family protein N-acetyltransferase
MRVTIRPWVEDDAAALSAAIADSLPELRPTMPWAGAEPIGLQARLAYIRGARDGEREGDRVRGIFVDGEVAGACGLHRRIARDGLEIGYWVRTSLTGRGVATAAVGLLCEEAFADDAITHVEIHHDAGNAASGAVARRAGFTHVGDRPRTPLAPGDTDTERIWRLTRDQYRKRI